MSDAPTPAEKSSAGQTDSVGKDDLLLATVAEHFLQAHRAGENPSIEDYARKHPQLGERMSELFPAMLEMERLRGAARSTTAAAAAAAAIPDFAPIAERLGATVGRYKLLERIGEGGFGVVYLAEQQQPIRRKVALKVIKPGVDTRQVIARFEAERQALALMDHQNIAKVLDAGATDSGRPYFVMELVKGPAITEYCDQANLNITQRLELFVQVCHAVQHAHQKGVIHRDIKPSNVLVAMHETTPLIKVIDFGVAKALGQEMTQKTLFTGFAELVGTPLYMSPEQAGYSSLDVDTRSDIYSLGVLLYELLTGTTPFERDRFKKAAHEEIRRIIREEEPPKPSTRLIESKESIASISAQRQTEPAKLRRLVRGELDWVVMKALEKDRSRRYETANGFAREIDRYLHDEPVAAGPPSASYRLWKFLRRNRRPVLAGVVILLCLVAGIIGTSAGLVWALRERNEKALALVAQTRARDAEAQARDRAMAALRALTDDVVENQMARGAQLTPENKEFLGRIIRHYEDFAAITADDAESRAIRAEGLHRIAMMRQRLGEPKEAETACIAALELRRQLSAAFPARPDFRQDLASTLHNLGLLRYQNGRPDESEQAFADALALRKQLAAEFPSKPQFRQDLTASYNNLAAVFQITGRAKEAEAAYEQVISLRKQLADEAPGRSEFRHGLARSYNNLGYLLQTTGRLTGAETAYGEAIALQKRLVADEPTRPEFRQELASSHNNFALLLRAAARASEAEKAYREALSLRRQLAAEFPARPEFRQELANTLNNLGVLFVNTQRPNEAEASYRDALVLWKQLADEFQTRAEFRQGLGRSHDNLGNVFQTSGRLSEAERAYADALALRVQLASDFPTQPDLSNDVATTCANQATLRLKQHDSQAAKNALEVAIPYHEKALKANPRNPAYQQCYRTHLAALVQAHAGLRDPPAANQAAEKFRDLGWEPPVDAYRAACALALCVPIVLQDDRVSKDQRDAQAATYMDAAMQALRAALSRGFRDTHELETGADLDPLRGREDFKKLLAELKESSPSTRRSSIDRAMMNTIAS